MAKAAAWPARGIRLSITIMLLYNRSFFVDAAAGHSRCGCL
jgi:hypothetical protein